MVEIVSKLRNLVKHHLSLSLAILFVLNLLLIVTYHYRSDLSQSRQNIIHSALNLQYSIRSSVYYALVLEKGNSTQLNSTEKQIQNKAMNSIQHVNLYLNNLIRGLEPVKEDEMKRLIESLKVLNSSTRDILKLAQDFLGSRELASEALGGSLAAKMVALESKVDSILEHVKSEIGLIGRSQKQQDIYLERIFITSILIVFSFLFLYCLPMLNGLMQKLKIRENIDKTDIKQNEESSFNEEKDSPASPSYKDIDSENKEHTIVEDQVSKKVDTSIQWSEDAPKAKSQPQVKINSYQPTQFSHNENKVEPSNKGEKIEKHSSSLISILVVDDSEMNRLIVSQFLKSEKHSLVFAENGEEAVQKFKESSFDVVFMDIQMPVMDGWEATAQIRAYEKKSQIEPCCIVALTALGRDTDVEKSVKAGCDHHFTKPVKKGKLQSFIGMYSKKAS